MLTSIDWAVQAGQTNVLIFPCSCPQYISNISLSFIIIFLFSPEIKHRVFKSLFLVSLFATSTALCFTLGLFVSPHIMMQLSSV